jgi:hypothetical protein
MMDMSQQETPAAHYRETLPPDSFDAQSIATDLEQRLQDFVRERPVAAVFAALGIGYVVARMFSRR